MPEPTRLDRLEYIADLAERLITEAHPLQEQFNPETYEVPADAIMKLSKALYDAEEAPPIPNHLATINGMIAVIDTQPYSAADQRTRLMLLILRGLWMSNDAIAEALVEQGKRLARLEEWQETMRGDGK